MRGLVAYGSGWRAAAEQKYKCAGAEHRKIKIPAPTSELRLYETHRRSIGAFFLQFCKLSLRRRLEIFLHAELSDGCLEVFDRGQHGMNSSYPEQAKQSKSKQEEPLPTELLLFLRQLRATKQFALANERKTHNQLS